MNPIAFIIGALCGAPIAVIVHHILFYKTEQEMIDNVPNLAERWGIKPVPIFIIGMILLIVMPIGIKWFLK
jgi:hypothetical protein